MISNTFLVEENPENGKSMLITLKKSEKSIRLQHKPRNSERNTTRLNYGCLLGNTVKPMLSFHTINVNLN